MADPRANWKRTLKRAWKLCIAQEHMMADVQFLNAQIFQTLRQGGAEFDPTPEQNQRQNREEVHICQCGRPFTTAQGLALHRVRTHQQYAPEHNLVCGATCPNCLRFFWSSAILQQHLAYIPRGGGGNRCYQALRERGYTTEYQPELLPRQRQGVLRLDALQIWTEHASPTSRR